MKIPHSWERFTGQKTQERVRLPHEGGSTSPRHSGGEPNRGLLQVKPERKTCVDFYVHQQHRGLDRERGTGCGWSALDNAEVAMIACQEVQGGSAPRVLYSRVTDGSRPVRVLDDGYEVIEQGGVAKHFATAQGLLAELTGHPTGRHWSLDRYFGTGKFEKPSMGQTDVFDLFAHQEVAPIVLQPLAPSLITLRSSMDITVPAERISPTQKNPGMAVSPARETLVVEGPVGIDLTRRAHEVRKLLFAGYGKRIFASGYDPDDVLQEVYRKLLVANQGKSPWDPSKSSFGHYVHMVCGSALSNFHRKQKRIKEMEQIGIKSLHKDGLRMGDVGSATNLAAKTTVETQDSLLSEAADDLIEFILDSHPHDTTTHLAIAILPHVTSGESRKQIAIDLGISMAALSRAVSRLRASACAWRDSCVH